MSLLLVLLAAAAEPAPAAEPPRLEFPAGRAVRGRWRMAAHVVVGIDDLPPTIADLRCAIAGPGLSLSYSVRGTEFEIGGGALGYRTADITGFEIGGIAYDAQWRREPVVRARFSDFDYPAGFVDPPVPGPAAIEGLVVRHRPEEPWLSHVTLVDDMIAVPAISIRYRQSGRERSARLATAGFGDALRWCQETLDSERAHRLPERLRRIIMR